MMMMKIMMMQLHVDILFLVVLAVFT